VVALAGLGFAVVNALYRNAWGTFTIAMTIPIGFIMGFYLQKFRPGQVAEVSLLGVVLLVAAVIFGRVVAQSSIAEWFECERVTLVWLLAGYGFLASVLPGWTLLVPRGYLSTFMKLGVVALLGVGVMLMAPTIEMPRVTIFVSGGGPIIPGTLFPFLFITIACGAVSGFHALVSSGTTPKMIEQESQATVGYGAMLLESFVGVMALIAASVLIPGDYLATRRGGCGGAAWRSRVARGRHGVHFFGAPWYGGVDGLLVSVCAGVRGVVHSDDDRYRHARGTLSHPGDGRAFLPSIAADELVAWCGGQ
jgi:carbon starvation protein